MRIPLIQGRDISDSDGADAQKVVIIDQFLAHKYFLRRRHCAKISRGSRFRETAEARRVHHRGRGWQRKNRQPRREQPSGQLYFSYKQYVREQCTWCCARSATTRY